MSKLNSRAATVKFPGIEHATAFFPQDKIPFVNAVIGTTMPDPSYRMSRSDSRPINVFEYVLDGEGELFCDGEWKHITAGDCYVLISGDAHEYRSKPQNPMKKLWINYIADYIPPMLASHGIKTGVYRAPDVHYHFSRLIDISEMGEHSDDTHFLIAECVHGIIHSIARSITSVPDDDEYGIKRALAARVYTKLNLDELASELHISKSQIIRSFKSTEGCTPYEYFLTLKVKTAKILLKDTKMQIREIAEKLSVCDEHYFSAMFHSRVGMTPREYRNKSNSK
ncbi:MAG: helix-turn-helix domain-containing protein [Clostridia bacterium]|nr:helix-turn-helix domain-containing protein [Clostridia bacterium]